MRSEHRTSADEADAFTGWRHFYRWRPGQRKLIKRTSHKKDRQQAKRRTQNEN